MTAFTTGDVVRLRSGGPKMTILKSEGEFKVACQWFDRNGKKHDAIFDTRMIEAFIARPREE